MKTIQNIIDLLENSIKENPQNSLTQGEIIADGYDQKVDEYRDLINHAKDWLANYQAKLIQETDILSLKIKEMQNIGYYIEVPKNQITKIPKDFILKQVLLTASRYTTLKLQEFEEKFLNAESEKANREYELFLEIRSKIMDNMSDIEKFANLGSNIDFITSLSQVAYENGFVKPEITTNYDLKISNGKHPIIMKNTNDFISNNLELTSKKFIHIITGPNMGGKSTFLRQNALIILLAHIGSFVPVNSASIPLTDKIFSRIGANDNLYMGQSTFMVEMQEIANILNNSTKNSFVIIDEIGRGTSTYDGMSLAWSILKENHDKIKAKTLFATHFHELIDESKKLNGVENFSVAVGENEENLIFLRKIIPGGIKKSFGIEVAKIAGLPENIIKEAREMLKKLEEEHNAEFGNQMSLVDLIKIQEENNRKLKTEKEKQLQSNCHFEFLVPLNDGDVTKGQEKFLPPSYEGRISGNKQRDFSESLTNSPNNIVKVPEKLFTDNDGFPYQAREGRDSGGHSQSEDTKLSALNEELENLDVNNITPIEALNKLAKLKKLLTF